MRPASGFPRYQAGTAGGSPSYGHRLTSMVGPTRSAKAVRGTTHIYPAMNIEHAVFGSCTCAARASTKISAVCLCNIETMFVVGLKRGIEVNS